MLKYIKSHFLFSVFLIFLSACTSSKTDTEEETDTKTKTETYEEAHSTLIISTAKDEQRNEMYSKSQDSTYLYWLNNKLILIYNHSKCNVFALNTLYKAGFKTPDENVLTKDLVDTSKFKDILPIVGISDPESAQKGDLISWNSHVIIFDYLVKLKEELYAQAWWAGTRLKDNGDNVINNVVYGKYKLNGYYVVRRPVKSNNK